jgi:ABC-type spermidine/putrescine transport system permease subunit I
VADTRTSPVGTFWPLFAAPGLLWLGLLFLVPFYAVLAVAMGAVDPIFLDTTPVWNPISWDPTTFYDVVGQVVGGGTLQVVVIRTVFYVFVAVAMSLLIGYPVAYFIARHGGRQKTLLLLLLIAPFWISYLMRMLAWINLLEPDGYVNRVLQFFQILDAPKLWLNGESITVILGLVYGYIPFLILPLYAAIDRIDGRLLEAARDLGASPSQTFFRVTLPLSKQGILAGCVVVMLPMFGDYYTADLMSGSPRTTMIGNLIDFYKNTATGGARAASIVIVLSVIVSLLMLYYLYSVAKGAREARA